MHPISWGHQHCTLLLTGTDGLVGNSEYEHFTTEINLDLISKIQEGKTMELVTQYLMKQVVGLGINKNLKIHVCPANGDISSSFEIFAWISSDCIGGCLLFGDLEM